MAVGSGRQSTVAYVNIVSYYVIGVPLGVLLAYVAKLEVQVRRPEPCFCFFARYLILNRHFVLQFWFDEVILH